LALDPVLALLPTVLFIIQVFRRIPRPTYINSILHLPPSPQSQELVFWRIEITQNNECRSAPRGQDRAHLLPPDVIRSFAMLEMHSGDIRDMITESHPRHHTWDARWQLHGLEGKAWRHVQVNATSMRDRRANESQTLG
jgi:hypothetical protein